MEEGIKNFIGKWVYVLLKSGRHYSGKITSIENDTISFIDKFNNLVLFNISEISSIEEEENYD